jgi:phosphotransferase system  glucose/maltose/N-acetylglucosamine-specific IIC component
MQDAGICCGHLVYFTAIWYMLWPFGTFVCHLVFFPFLVCCNKKNLATQDGPDLLAFTSTTKG